MKCHGCHHDEDNQPHVMLCKADDDIREFKEVEGSHQGPVQQDLFCYFMSYAL